MKLMEELEGSEVERARLPEPSMSPSLVGQLVDERFSVIRHIGSGGMADVFEVEHVRLGRRMAMKVLRQTSHGSPRLVKRFVREARAVSCLNSEHIVSIHDYGELPSGAPYFVMDLLLGRSLRDELHEQGPLSTFRAANLGIDVCLGLKAAHTAGLVHRDLKPENLWLARGDDGRERCLLLDFGVARFEGTHSTSDGALVGTASYMSPEQIAGREAPGPRSDLFSLGVILYECLTGASPFAADSLERTLFRILNEEPAPIVELPEAMARTIERALAKRPDQRFESALAMASSLRACVASVRPLPVSEVRAATGAHDTLAENPGVVVGTRRSARFGFGLGFGVAAVMGVASLALWSPRPARSLRATLHVHPAIPRASVDASVTMAPGASAQAVSTALPPPRKASGRPIPNVTPSSSTRPPRMEPPGATFDGRNPYLQ